MGAESEVGPLAGLVGALLLVVGIFDGIDQWPCSEPTPEFAAIVAENLREQLSVLDESLAEVALLKMQGYTNREIGDRIGRSVPTIERYLRLIRTTWTNEQIQFA